jgi:chromosome segregation ATPase
MGKIIPSMSASSKNSRALDDLETALQCCREVAEVEYAVADAALEAADVIAKDAEGRIARLLVQIREHSRQGDGLRETVDGIGQQIAVQIEELQDPFGRHELTIKSFVESGRLAMGISKRATRRVYVIAFLDCDLLV